MGLKEMLEQQAATEMGAKSMIEFTTLCLSLLTACGRGSRRCWTRRSDASWQRWHNAATGQKAFFCPVAFCPVAERGRALSEPGLGRRSQPVPGNTCERGVLTATAPASPYSACVYRRVYSACDARSGTIRALKS